MWCEAKIGLNTLTVTEEEKEDEEIDWSICIDGRLSKI
jgi:hypothetical protein